MEGLTYPDLHHAHAAEGWLDLNVPAEARLELEQISAQARAHPEVLDLRWRLASHIPDWNAAVSVADQIIAAAPGIVTGWIHRSFALHELRRTAEALDNLIDAEARFPTDSLIPYNLACYACQLGDLPQARRWLKRALELKGIEKLRTLALDDPDLAPLRSEIAEW
jgi:tetratricopeptide (TPR) repeat protein